MLKNVKIWFAVYRNDINSYTTEGASFRYFSLPTIPRVSDYLRDSNGNFYRVIDPILYHKDQTEITAIKADKSDTLWHENTKEGNHILLPVILN